MKKITIFLSAMVAVALLWSCEDSGKNAILKENPDPAVIASPVEGTAYVLLEDDATDTLDHFAWNAADFGFQAAAVYEIQLDLENGDFSTPVMMTSTTDLTVAPTVEEFNQAVKKLELTPEVAATIQMRVVANVNDNVESSSSAPVKISVTPYEAVVVYPALYVPGGHNGWDPSNATTVLYSENFNDKYEGYIYFPANNSFKITPEPNWDSDWGDDGADGTLEVKGANMSSTDEGYYKINVDLAALTIATAVESWGIIGDATPTEWASDTDLLYDETSNTLKVTIDLIGGKHIKFRLNDDWGVSLGDLEGDGILDSESDNNILIETTGSYIVTLDFSKPIKKYSLELQ